MLPDHGDKTCAGSHDRRFNSRNNRGSHDAVGGELGTVTEFTEAVIHAKMREWRLDFLKESSSCGPAGILKSPYPGLVML